MLAESTRRELMSSRMIVESTGKHFMEQKGLADGLAPELYYWNADPGKYGMK